AKVDGARAVLPQPRAPKEELPPVPPALAPSAECLFTAQPHGEPMLFLAVRRTYAFDEQGRVRLADEQLPLPDDYDYYADVPEGVIPACKTTPEGFFKGGTDVVLKGFACTYGRPATSLEAKIQIDDLQRSALIVGQRRCELRAGAVAFTEPNP